jgi:hypothetical protein
MKNFKTSFAQSLMVLGLALTAGSITAEQSKDHSSHDVEMIESQLKLGVINQVGNYKLRLDQYGEPAAMPIRLSVEIDCGSSKRPFVAFYDIVACGGGSVSKDKKNLILSFLKPDQKEKCARKVTETVALADLCK